MKKFPVIILFFLLTTAVSAQYYHTAIGIRTGLAMGINVKHNVDKQNAFEGILSYRWGGYLLTGLFEFTQPSKTPRLNWYYGFGGHLGYWSSKNGGNNPGWWETGHEGGYTVLGLDAIIGIEYTFENTPFNLSLDWKPVFNVFGNSSLWGDMFAISIRYTLLPRIERDYRKSNRYY